MNFTIGLPNGIHIPHTCKHYNVTFSIQYDFIQGVIIGTA